jgi:photosystem II protein
MLSLRSLLLTALVSPSVCFSIGAPASVKQATASVTAAAAIAPAAAAPSLRVREAVMEEAAASAAYIEFIIGVPEPVVPDVSLTRSKDGSTGVATFTFDNPSFLAAASEALGETTGMYLKDSEGTIKTSEVTATFTNGKPRFVKGIVVLKSSDEWDRFMRFMERYAETNGLGFSKA